MFNLNSFENLATILRSLGLPTNIKHYSNEQSMQRRMGLYIEKDGGILNLVLKLIYNVYQCARCNESIYDHKNSNEHLCAGAFSLKPQYNMSFIWCSTVWLDTFWNECWEIIYEFMLEPFYERNMERTWFSKCKHSKVY